MALTFWAFYYFFPASDKDMIGNSFTNLSGYVEKKTGEGGIKMAYKTNVISTLFVDPCGLEIPYSFHSGSYTRNQITSNAVKARAQFKHVSLDFYDVNFEALNENEASTVFTARLSGELKGGRCIDETREVEATLKKEDGHWLFTNFRVVEVLQR